jgi:DNA polymerase elongation subunit (family B)
MTIEEVVVRMKEKSYLMEMGRGKLSKYFKCSKEDISEAKRIVRRVSIKKPRILVLDIETAPIKAYVWRLWKQDISTGAILSDYFMIGWAAKWLSEDNMMSQCLSSKEILMEDDCRIVETLWHLLNQADIVIAHNGERFDIPRIRSRFLVHGLPPTTHYSQIDTLKVAKKEFGFSSNKLDYLAQMLGIDGKIVTGLDLWVRCMQGDEVALKQMELYNRHDVEILEDVYMRLRPYIKSHPNLNLYNEDLEASCPSCGGKDLAYGGYYYTQTGKYQAYACRDCGAISRKRKTILPKEKELLISIPGR